MCQQLCAPQLASSSLEWAPKHHCSLPNTRIVSVQAIIGVNKRLVWLRFTVVYRSDLEAHGDPSDLRGRVEQPGVGEKSTTAVKVKVD